MNKAFIEDVRRILEPDGQLHFWTDVADYYEAAISQIEAIASFTGPIEVEAAKVDHDLDYRTHFERRMRLVDSQVYRAQFICR